MREERGGWLRSQRLLCAALAGLCGVAPVPQATASAPAPLEVVICESHHEVLVHWLRAARQGRLPGSGIEVVHLDAHPDLAVPAAPLPRSAGDDPATLLRALDISSFQLGAVWIGLVRRIVWLRPPFARQLPDGERRFRLGLDPAGRLRVDDPSDYYVLDEGWAPTASLRDAVSVELRVAPWGSMGWAPAPGATVLDIDLDAFATRNPAADRLRRAGLADADLDRLRAMFAPEELHLEPDPAARIRQLERLLAAIEALALGPWRRRPGAAVELWRAGLGPIELYRLWSILATADPALPLDVLLEEGRQLVGLPEHVRVTRRDVLRMARQLGELLRDGSLRPALVTVSRSVEDGFTPRHLWPLIEWSLLDALEAARPDLRLRFDAGLSPAPRPGRFH